MDRERERDIVVRIMVIIAVFSPLWPTLLMILMEEWKLEGERERGWIILRFVPRVFWVRTETKRNVEKS